MAFGLNLNKENRRTKLCHRYILTILREQFSLREQKPPRERDRDTGSALMNITETIICHV